MTFGAQKINPIDTKPGTAVGVAIPFNAPAVFFSTYTTKDAIKNNLINFLLTNRTERYLNPDFGGNLRQFIFEQIANDSIDYLKESIQQYISTQFSNIKINNLEITQYPDSNQINLQLSYSIISSGVTDQVIKITFT
jgi:phage baseplate assembly protein W